MFVFVFEISVFGFCDSRRVRTVDCEQHSLTVSSTIWLVELGVNLLLNYISGVHRETVSLHAEADRL